MSEPFSSWEPFYHARSAKLLDHPKMKRGVFLPKHFANLPQKQGHQGSLNNFNPQNHWLPMSPKRVCAQFARHQEPEETSRTAIVNRKTRDSRRDTWAHQNEHFVRDFLQFSHFVASKSTFSYEFSSRTRKFATSKSMFRARLPSIFSTSQQNATPATEFAPCCHLTQPCQCDCKNTPPDTSKVLRLPRKMTMDTSKVLRLPRKLQHIFWKRRKSIAPATENDFRHVTKHVWMSRSATPATRNEATRRLKPPKMIPSAELIIGTAIRGSRGRLRTVANVNATSSEHALSPQTPRVKREPLLRIRE